MHIHEAVGFVQAATGLLAVGADPESTREMRMMWATNIGEARPARIPLCRYPRCRQLSLLQSKMRRKCLAINRDPRPSLCASHVRFLNLRQPQGGRPP